MRFLRRHEPREETWQLRLYFRLIVLLLAVAYAVAFAIENSKRTKVHFVFGSTHVSLVWLILLCFAIGVLGGVLLSQLYRRRGRKERPEPADAVPDLPGGNEAEGEPN